MKQQKKKCGSHRTLKTVGIIAGALLVLTVTLTFLLFAPLPVREFQLPTMADVAFHSRLAGRVLKQVWQGKPEQDELVLTQMNVDSLLHLADQAWELDLKPADLPPGVMPPRCWQLQLLPDGRMAAAFPYDTGWKILRGGGVMLRVEFTLQKEADQPWQIKILNAKAGRLPLSSMLLTALIQPCLTQLEAAGKLDKLNAAVRSFRVDAAGQIHLVYRPNGFLQILQ